MLKRITVNSPPHHILWWSAVSFLLVAGMLRNKEVDIQLHDTYIVLNMLIVGLAFGAAVGILGATYWLLKRRPLTPWLTKTHVWVSIISLYICMWVIITQSIPELNQHSYSAEVNILGVAAFLAFLLAQLLFAFNVARSLFR